MSKITHASVPGVVTVQLVDSLIEQMTSTPMPRIRAAARNQLYSIGVAIYQVSKALQRDLEAGDAILNAKTHEDQNEAPETRMWLEWLAMYQIAEDQLRKIEDAIRDSSESEAA